MTFNGLKILPRNRALIQCLQYRRQDLVLQCHIKHEHSLLLSYFGICQWDVARHNGIVIKSNTYFFPEMSMTLVVHFLEVIIILANKVVELSSIQKSGWLKEYVFILAHSSHLYSRVKLQNQVHFISKKTIINYNSTNSRYYLLTFTGQ